MRVYGSCSRIVLFACPSSICLLVLAAATTGCTSESTGADNPEGDGFDMQPAAGGTQESSGGAAGASPGGHAGTSSGGNANAGSGGHAGAPLGSGGGLNASGGAAGKRDAGAGGAGGGSAIGGAGGSGGTLPHTVSPCDAGGAMLVVGQWDNITPPAINLTPGFQGFNTGVNSFVIDPTNTATLYVGSCAQGIYKSTNCGASWMHISTGTNGASLDHGRNWTMAIDPVEPNVIYANSGYGDGGLWKSTDGAVSWTQLFPANSVFAKAVSLNFVEFVALDPTDHRHLPVSSHADCVGEAAGPVCLAESGDAGATWKMIKAHPAMSYEASGHAMLDHDTWLYFQVFGGIFLTQDAGKTWTRPYTVYADNQAGEVTRDKDGNYYVASPSGVVKSPNGLSWSLIPNSPRSTSLAGDGTVLFTSINDPNPAAPYSTSSGNFSTWKPYPAPQISKGSWLMRYDVDHHLLYSSNELAGFWRVRTQ